MVRIRTEWNICTKENLLCPVCEEDIKKGEVLVRAAEYTSYEWVNAVMHPECLLTHATSAVEEARIKVRERKEPKKRGPKPFLKENHRGPRLSLKAYINEIQDDLVVAYASEDPKRIKHQYNRLIEQLSSYDTDEHGPNFEFTFKEEVVNIVRDKEKDTDRGMYYGLFDEIRYWSGVLWKKDHKEPKKISDPLIMAEMIRTSLEKVYPE